MTPLPAKDAIRLAQRLIEEQLTVLTVFIPASAACGRDSTASAGAASSTARADALHDSARDQSLPDLGMNAQVCATRLQGIPLDQEKFLCVLASNALLAIGMFLQAHSMSTLRTAEIQFLGHVRNAILNGGLFAVGPGEIPLASFDGRMINESLNGRPVFADSSANGFLAPADAVALLSWLWSYLHQTQELVSGGDAG
ncbi:MAG: hypothetical protein NVSMB6_14250 [Burkholderiaceae bacterium]